MAVKMRLRREGKKKQPFYRVVVADVRAPRDGGYIEDLGYYQPLHDPSTISIDRDRALYWLRTGAQPSDAVLKLLRIEGIWEEYRPGDPGKDRSERNAKREATKQAKQAAAKAAKPAPVAQAAPEAVVQAQEEVAPPETTAEEAPATAEEAPATAEEAPATAEEAPATAEEAPATAEEAPATAEEAPATAEEPAQEEKGTP